MPVRPHVDVVVPVAGAPAAVDTVRERMAVLDLRQGDTLTIVDDGSGNGSYAARNRGAADGQAPWLVFLDADVTPPSDMLDRLFDPAPAETTAVLAGGVRDDPQARTMAERYVRANAAMAQDATLGGLGRPFAQTANCAVRRAAFETVRGFVGDVRSGGDADLCFRLADAGWEVERRNDAAVLHDNRSTVRALLRQRARHGAGAAWLEREHPGSLPARSLPGLVWWGSRRAAAGLGALTRGDRDGAAHGLLDGPLALAFELGRQLPNRP